MSVNVGVFGLGSMGYGMAKSCLAAGLATYGFDVNADSVARFSAEGGQTGDLADIAPTLDAVVVVVLNAAQVEDVLFGANGAVPGLSKGAVVMACATVPPDFAKNMDARCGDHGVHYLDAPISGGSIKAGQGQLGVMASGSADAFAAAQPVLDATAETVFTLGDAAGAGSAMKAVNQLLAGVHIATMAEALTFGVLLLIRWQCAIIFIKIWIRVLKFILHDVLHSFLLIITATKIIIVIL
ncbi:MAG: NAD(P)-binding domain-containing protein [Pseudomonadota bacterium]